MEYKGQTRYTKILYLKSLVDAFIAKLELKYFFP